MATPDSLDRLSNIVATLAHPDGDHADNDLEDEAHDIIRQLRQTSGVGIHRPVINGSYRCASCQRVKVIPTGTVCAQCISAGETKFIARCNYCGHLPCDCTER